MMGSFMTGGERARAKAVGVPAYLRGKRFRTLKEAHIFSALDAGVSSMQSLGFPDPYNGRVLAALAVVLVANDEKSLGDMAKRKIKAIAKGSEDERKEFLELVSFEISERYLEARKSEIPAETKITSPESLVEKLGNVFEVMEKLGKEMAGISVMSDEMALTLENEMPDATNIAEALVGGVIGSYESLVPAVNDDGDLPTAVERRAIAKAAFLRLGVDDLAELAAENGIEDVPTKAAMAKALAEVYEDDLEKVAKLTLRQTEGDPSFGLITRLLPLSSAPSIQAARKAFESLRGHYFEVRPAIFFVFGAVTLSPDERFLTIAGAIRSFSVSPVEVGGETELNARPRKDDISIRLQADQKWATVTARRASDLAYVGAVLRRSGEVSPSPSVAAPSPLAQLPYSVWDARSLWMLDFFRRDLQAETLKLENTLMANFDSSKASDLQEEGDEGKPRLASVKLRGMQLQDHPEVCARIVGRAHLKDVEFRLRKVTDQENNFSTHTRIRLSWERDHVAILTGADGETLDPELHNRLVRLVRDAIDKPLSTELIPILQRIETRAQETEVEADADGVLTGPSPVPPEPQGEEISVGGPGAGS
jgi:hypothetical protein